MRACCWLSRAHWNIEIRRSPKSCSQPPARSSSGFSHRRLSDTKEAAVSMQVHPVVAVPLILTWFSYIVQYVKCMYKGNTWTTQRRKNSICASSSQYPAVTKNSSGLKIAEEQILAKEARETTVFLIPRPSESDCCFWLSLWCRHVQRCSPFLKKFSLSVNNM